MPCPAKSVIDVWSNNNYDNICNKQRISETKGKTIDDEYMIVKHNYILTLIVFVVKMLKRVTQKIPFLELNFNVLLYQLKLLKTTIIVDLIIY